jgi:hypothetical protein
METERAPGTRELITRGPDGSAVRSNIRPMVQEHVPGAAARLAAATGLVATPRPGYPVAGARAEPSRATTSSRSVEEVG